MKDSTFNKSDSLLFFYSKEFEGYVFTHCVKFQHDHIRSIIGEYLQAKKHIYTDITPNPLKYLFSDKEFLTYFYYLSMNGQLKFLEIKVNIIKYFLSYSYDDPIKEFISLINPSIETLAYLQSLLYFPKSSVILCNLQKSVLVNILKAINSLFKLLFDRHFSTFIDNKTAILEILNDYFKEVYNLFYHRLFFHFYYLYTLNPSPPPDYSNLCSNLCQLSDVNYFNCRNLEKFLSRGFVAKCKEIYESKEVEKIFNRFEEKFVLNFKDLNIIDEADQPIYKDQ